MLDEESAKKKAADRFELTNVKFLSREMYYTTQNIYFFILFTI